MARPILRLALRVDRRTRWTAWAIACACMVLVGSLSLVAGLRSGADAVISRIPAGPALYIRGGDLLSSRIDPNSLAGLQTDFSALRIHAGTLETNGLTLDVVVASVEDVSGGNATAPYPSGSNDVSLDSGLVAAITQQSGKPLDSSANLTVLGARLANLPIVAPPPSRLAILPDDWAYVRPELLVAVSPQEGGSIQGIVTASPLDSTLVSSLGLTKVDLVGVVGFVQGSVDEAESALLALDVVIGAVIALLVYFAMSLEVHQRTGEIKTLRSLGASPAVVALLYEGQAFTLAAIGATVGSALGIILAHAIVSLAPLAGLPNLVVLEPPFAAMGLAFATAILASAFAALVPSRRAAVLVRTHGGSVPS